MLFRSYLRSDVTDARGPVVPGRRTQDIRAIDATWRRGFTEVRGELAFDRWDVFRVANPARDVGYYVEARRTLFAGIFAAVRYGAIRFRDLASGSGRVDRWDYDSSRWQVAGGYRLGRNSELRVEFMRNDTARNPQPKANLLSFQWWLSL